MYEFIAQHLNHPVNHPALWAAVVAVLAFIAILSIEKLAKQPFFGGRKHRNSLEEHYLHGEISTPEFEDRKCPRQST